MTRARDLSSILAADGSLNISTSVNLADNEKAYFGTSNDLQIYHDGSNSIIAENSTGSLKIQGSDLYLTDDDGTNMLYAANNGGVTLYYGGGASLATTSTGVDVTGGLDLTSTGVPDVSHNTTATGAGSLVGRTLYRWQGTDVAQIRVTAGTDTVNHDDASMSFFTSDGTFAERMRIASSGNVGIGTSSPSDSMEISQSNNTGGTLGLQIHNTNTGTAGNYAGIYATAVNGLIGMRANAVQTTSLSARVQVGSTTAHPVSFVTSDTERMRIDTSGRVGIGTSSPSALLQLEGSDGTPQLKFLRTGTNIGGIIRQISSPYGLTYDAIDGNAGAPTHVFRTSVDGSSFTERMRIDSSGRVTMPYQPMVSATRTTNFGTLGGNTLLMPYNSATVNVGNHYNASTGLFTCPVSGKYRVTAYGMNVAASGSGVFYYNALLVEVAGSTQQGTPYNYGDGYVHMSGSWIVSASANDSIGIRTSSCLGGYGGMTIELIG